MSHPNPISVFGVFLDAERKRVTCLNDDINVITLRGPNNHALLMLKKRLLFEAEGIVSLLEHDMSSLKSRCQEPTQSYLDSLREARDTQWQLTQLAQRLVRDGAVPPAWDEGAKPPSFAYVLSFVFHPKPTPRIQKVREGLLGIFDEATWAELRHCDGQCHRSLDQYGAIPCPIDTRLKFMCLEGYPVEVMDKVIETIWHTASDAVPCSILPADAITVPAATLTSAAAAAAAAASAKVRRLEHELVYLVLQKPISAKMLEENKQLVEETERLLAKAKEDEAKLRREVLRLCIDSFFDFSHQDTFPLRPFLNTQFLLTELSDELHVSEIYRSGIARNRDVLPPFDYVLSFLHSDDSDPETNERREVVRGYFNESEWELLIAMNRDCFNALYNVEPPKIDGYHQIDAELSPSTLTQIARVLGIDFDLAFSHRRIQGSAAQASDQKPVRSPVAIPASAFAASSVSSSLPSSASASGRRRRRRRRPRGT